MIALVDAGNENDFLRMCDGDELFGADIRTHYAVYGGGARESIFWLASDRSGKPTAALNREVGRVMLAAREDVDTEELGQFLSMVGGFSQLRAEAGLCERLLPVIGGRLTRAPAMSYRGALFGGDYSAIRDDPALDDLYQLLCTAFDDFMPAGRWRWHAFNSHLFRHGLGYAVGIYIGGRIVSTGGVYGQTAHYSLIASVATASEFRGSGYAARITRCLCDRILMSGRTPVLLCAEPSLTEFYGRLGFTLSREWGQIDR